MRDEAINRHLTRVRTKQVDVTGVMYHGAYLDVFDDARIETFRRLGCTYATTLEEGWSPVIRRLDCRYYLPARMDDLLEITVWIAELTRATMTIRYECRRDGQLLAMAHVQFAFVDLDGKPIRVPGSVRAPLETLAPEMLSPTPR